MKRLYTAYLLLLIFSFCACSPKNFEEENERNPGFYKQWFERHKDENGKIPENIHSKWFKQDLESFKRLETRGASPIISIQQMASDVQQGGRTRAILIDTRDSNRMWAGGVSGGLWKTSNGGQSWEPINDAASTLAVTCITQNTLKPTELYYGTGEVIGGNYNNASGGLQALPGSGIFKSKDGGLTFEKLASTEGVTDLSQCNIIKHSLAKDSTVFVGTANGLYRSISAGETWSKVLNGFVSDILCLKDGQILVGVAGDGVYSSADGSSFAKLNISGAPSSPAHILINNCKTQPNSIYIWYTSYTSNPNAGLFRSDDNGKTWAKKADASSTPSGLGTTQGGYNQVLGVHPTNPDYVVIGGQGALMTQDGGATWKSFDAGHPDHHAFTAIGTSDNFILANDGGMYKINWKGGPTLNLNNNYITFQFYGGNYGATGTLAITGAQDNGTWRFASLKTAAEITSAFFPSGGTVRADGGYAHISQQNPDLAYMSIQNGQVFRSSNFSSPGGGTFEKINLPDQKEGVEFINLFEMNYADGKQVFYRTNKGLWRTLNAGNDWERMNLDDIPNIQSIGISLDADPTVYIGGYSCFYRIDKAASFVTPDTFVNLRSKVPALYRLDSWGNISFHPKEKTTLYVGLTNMVTNSRVIKIKNAHTANPEWNEIGGNLPARLPVYQVQAHPDQPDTVLFAATAFGLYYTLDGGKNWVKETRVPNVQIFEMKMRASDKSLFLFTHGRGVFYLNLNTLTKTNEILPDNNLKIYPNPASDVLNIETDYPLSWIQIFTLDGKEILNNKNANSINISSLRSGIYFIKAFDEKGRFALKKFVKQ